MKPQRPSPPAARELVTVLHALADPVRLKIARMASGRELACGAFGLRLSKPTMSYHFRILREAGVIQQRRDGTHRMTSLRRKELDRKFPGLLKSILGD